jgi:ribosomal protein S18 acetylase RimI-like enzyme
MEQLAAQLKVPDAELAAFAEVFACQGARGAKNYRTLLQKVRSNHEVLACIDAMAAEGKLPALDDKMRDRLVFCGRYSAKAGTALDQALDQAAAGTAAALATREACAALPGGKLPFTVRQAKFGDEHLAARGAAFPYRPSVSATHGSAVLEARASQTVAGVVAKGTLVGYVAVQGGGYIDDIAILPQFHGQGGASGLLAAAAALEVQSRRTELSLDVRAANVPAIKLYRALGFEFSPLAFPGFLDWDGGLEGQADAATVLTKQPPNCRLEV